MRTIVFSLPEIDSELLVTLGLDGGPTLALRPMHGTWGPPIPAKSDSDDLNSVTFDLDAFVDSLMGGDPMDIGDELQPGQIEEAVVFDATIQKCPLCGADLVATWSDNIKKCPSPPAGCGAQVRIGLAP